MANIWDKQDYETPISFNHFQKYFLLQPAPRSLTKAYRQFRLEKGDTDPERVKKLYASGAWSNWFNGKDGDGNYIPGSFSWADRADAYDRNTFLFNKDDYEKSKKDLLKKEINDANTQLELWDFASRSFHEYVTKKKAELDNENELFNPSNLINKGRELIKWRDDIAAFTRRAYKMPSTIKDLGVVDDDDNEIKIKWNEPLSDDDDIGIGGGKANGDGKSKEHKT